MIEYLAITGGIVLSLALPILRSKLPVSPAERMSMTQNAEFIKPYIYIAVFSLLTAVLVYAFAGKDLGSWQNALLIGYAWDSTLQKIVKPT